MGLQVAMSVCILLGVSGLTPAAAAGRQLVGRSETPLLADGTRFAVYKSSNTKLSVRDDKRERRFRLSVAPSCEPQDVARPGLLLLRCSRGDGEHHVVDLRTRTSVRVQEMEPDPFLWYDPDYEGFGDVGARWLKGSSAMGPVVPFFLNWHTGERRAASDDDARYTPVDLGSPDLDQIAPPQPHGFAFDKDRTFSIAQADRDDSKHGFLAGDLLLYRDGTANKLGTRVAILSRCRGGCIHVGLGAGLVTWAEGRVAHAYTIRSRRHVAWTLEERIGAGLQHTRMTLYWTRRASAGHSSAVYAIPLP